MTYSTLDEAIDYVNDHPRPLALYFFSHDKAATDRVLNETISGGVTVNETMLHVAQDDLPFGGVGPSGMGALPRARGLRDVHEEEGRLPSGARQYDGPPATALR